MGGWMTTPIFWLEERGMTIQTMHASMITPQLPGLAMEISSSDMFFLYVESTKKMERLVFWLAQEQMTTIMVTQRFTISRTRVQQLAHECLLAHYMGLTPIHLETPLLLLVAQNLWREMPRAQISFTGTP